MLQADDEAGGDEREGEVRLTGYDSRKETMRQSEGGKEEKLAEKREMGENRQETGSTGPVLMLNAR